MIDIDENGNTALHRALLDPAGLASIPALLENLDLGDLENVRNHDGKNVRDLAVERMARKAEKTDDDTAFVNALAFILNEQQCDVDGGQRFPIPAEHLVRFVINQDWREQLSTPKARDEWIDSYMDDTCFEEVKALVAVCYTGQDRLADLEPARVSQLLETTRYICKNRLGWDENRFEIQRNMVAVLLNALPTDSDREKAIIAYLDKDRGGYWGSSSYIPYVRVLDVTLEPLVSRLPADTLNTPDEIWHHWVSSDHESGDESYDMMHKGPRWATMLLQTGALTKGEPLSAADVEAIDKALNTFKQYGAVLECDYDALLPLERDRHASEMLRQRVERLALRASAQETMRAPAVPSLGGMVSRLDARTTVDSANDAPAAPRVRRRL